MKINRVFIIPVRKCFLFHYSNKKLVIIPFKNLLIPLSPPPPENGIISLFEQKLPLFLRHYSRSPPKIEQAMLSLSESESIIVIIFRNLL